VLFIEHDMDVIMANSDRVVVMADGEVIASGTPREIQNNRLVVDAYLGQVSGTSTAHLPRGVEEVVDHAE
jgi:branched-chain amino acid transport system ATP-binding protein